LIAAAALVVLANAFALAGVAWNRRGEPEAVVELTAREFYVSRWPSDQQENTGLSLGLSWNGTWHQDGEPDWLDAGKLRELGFDTSVAPGTEEAAVFYRRQTSRLAFVALEMEGPAWAKYLERQQSVIEETTAKVARGETGSQDLSLLTRSLERARVEHSRLFAIDAASDAGSLRSRHPDRTRVFILPARVAISSWNIKEASEVRGHIQSLLIPNFHVPRKHRTLLDRALVERQSAYDAARKAGLRPSDSEPPQPAVWAVTVAFGRRLEPWIVSVRSLPD
jgi:hypothetical protein